MKLQKAAGIKKCNGLGQTIDPGRVFPEGTTTDYCLELKPVYGKLRKIIWTIAKNNPKCNVYALDSDGNFFNARDATVDPYSQLKKKHADKERFYMKKILVTGIVYGPSKKYDLEAGEWEERDDIMKFVKVKY